jgi:hypothetical protein
MNKLTLSEQQRNEWVKSYETTSKLPSTLIPCCKCSIGITATHGNLVSKVKSHGGILNLLTKFVCRNCTKASAAPRAPKTNNIQKKKKKFKKVLSPLDEIKDERGRYNIPNVNLTNEHRKQYTLDEIASNEALAKEFTDNVCLRPNVYLNSDSSCDDCNLFKYCGCTVKRLSKAKLKSLEKL